MFVSPVAFDTYTRLSVAAFAAVLLSAGAYEEGTHGNGWSTVSAYSPNAWAENSHEPPLWRLAGLLHAAVLVVLAAAEFDATYSNAALGVARCAGSLVVWAVLLTRIAAATHATDENHSVVNVPWYSVVSATLVAAAPAMASLLRPSMTT